MNIRAHLTRIQVAVNAFRTMIVNPIELIAHRAPDTNIRLMIHMNGNALLFFLDRYLVDEPRRLYP